MSTAVLYILFHKGIEIERGIVQEIYSTIYPGQTTVYKELPSECELGSLDHYLKNTDFTYETIEFQITEAIVNLIKLQK